jgi:hypothetical protein
LTRNVENFKNFKAPRDVVNSEQSLTILFGLQEMLYYDISLEVEDVDHNWHYYIGFDLANNHYQANNCLN